MNRQVMLKEAERRGFGYICYRYEVYHPKHLNKMRTFFLGYEATDFIAYVAETKGVAYASQMRVKKVVFDIWDTWNSKKKAFVQWIKPVENIKVSAKIIYEVDI